MYSLNNIPLSNFGIIAGRAEATNIAVAGHLDMPERIGKTYHDWTDEKGLEPYVLAEEIRHGGRNIKFGGLLKAEDKASALSTLKSFYREIDGFNALMPFSTPWGSFNVYVKEKIEAIYLQEGYLKFNMEFREPVVANDGNLPAGTETVKSHIDGVSFDSLGMFLTGVNDHLNRPEIKEQQFTAYENEGFQITPAKPLDFEARLVAYADDYATLEANIKSMHALLASPGTRTINIDGTAREVFNIKGFKVSGLKVLQQLVVCQVTLPMMMANYGEELELSELIVPEDDQLVNDINQIIQIY